MFLSLDALGLLSDLRRAGRGASLARPTPLEEAACASRSDVKRANFALYFHDSISVVCRGDYRMARPRAGSFREGTCVERTNWAASGACGRCGRRHFGASALDESAENGAGGSAAHEPVARHQRKNPSTSGPRADSLPGARDYRGLVRGVSVPRVCDGGALSSRAANRGCCAAELLSFWPGALVPREKRPPGDIPTRRHVRDRTNCLRQPSAGCRLAFDCGCGGGTGRTKVLVASSAVRGKRGSERCVGIGYL